MTQNKKHGKPKPFTLDRGGRSILAILLTMTSTWGCGGVTPAPAPAGPPLREPIADLPGFDPACSNGIARQLRSQAQPIRLITYISKRTPALEHAGARLVELVRWFERAGDGKVVVDVREAKTEAEIQEAVESGLRPFNPMDDLRSTPDLRDAAVCGIAFEGGGEKEAIPRLARWTPEGLRGWIVNKIVEILDRAEGRKKIIGVVSGKSEIKLSEPNLIVAPPGGKRPSILSIITEALPFYPVEEIDLHGGDASIRSDLAGLLITQPGAPFSEQELRRIDELVLRGKPLVVLASAVNLKAGDVTMHATLDTWSLDRLLTGYGIEMRREALLDWDRTMKVPVQLQDGRTASIPIHGLVVAQEGAAGLVNVGLPFFKMDELAFPFPSPLVPHPEKQPDATMKVLARSSANASVDASETLDLKFSSQLSAKGDLGARAMAILLHGKIRSAFGGQGPTATAARGRLLVVSSSEFLTNPLARASNPVKPDAAPSIADEDVQMLSGLYAQQYLTATILAFKNILDWMALDDELVACFEEKGPP